MKNVGVGRRRPKDVCPKVKNEEVKSSTKEKVSPDGEKRTRYG